MTERDLLLAYKAAKQERDIAKDALKAAQEKYDGAETKLIEHLEGTGAASTAKYDGIGYAQLCKPRVYASCVKENEERLKTYLRDKGRADLIKETISPQTLSAFVAELIDNGQALPTDIVSYYLKQNVRMY